MNTNMTGFRWCSKIFATLCLGRKLQPHIGRANLGLNKKYVCFLLHARKNRVGRQGIYFILSFIFFSSPCCIRCKCKAKQQHLKQWGIQTYLNALNQYYMLIFDVFFHASRHLNALNQYYMLIFDVFFHVSRHI